MKWIVCDTEVFKNDWIFVGKHFGQDEYYKIHNDIDALKRVMDIEDAIFIGFNMKGYDRFIMDGIYNGYYPAEIKKINDYIIGGGRGWDIQMNRTKVNYCDIMDDMQMGTSLKSIEGHLGKNIEETEVDFNLDRSLTPEEIELTFKYCTADVDNTENVVKLRMEYLQTKINLGSMCGLSEAEALSMTNAKLTAKYLGAVKSVEWTDEREYQLPNNIKKSQISTTILDFFDQIHDKTIPSETLFKSSLEYTFQNCPSKLAWGGLHGAIPQSIFVATDNWTIRNYDVGSYYPNLMIKCNYLSRNIEDRTKYENVVATRLAAKKAGDKQKANDLKLIVNTTYGATLNQYNELYDPLMARSVCISGQLFLSELCQSYIDKVPNMEIIQINTDGVMIGFDTQYLDVVNEINEEWQQRTQFTLEEDIITKVVQKDVNNYLMITDTGKVKTKGAYFKSGVNTVGQFSINNNMTIVTDAIYNYFVNDTPVEETIGNCNDLFKFQLIAKGGSKYAYCYQEIGTGHQRVQNVNRVYATNDDYYGTLYKVKKGDNSVAKIAGLPEHCLVDNANRLNINDIDKQFYIDIANKRIEDFKGGKDMATTKTVAATTNVYAKLLAARTLFLQSGTKKSGKNFSLSYTYFELEDIVPKVTEIFNKVGLLSIVNVNREEAMMTIVDIDSPHDVITFTAPFALGVVNKGTTEIQAVGSSLTYLRRYLYMLALNIIEADSVEVAKPVSPVETQPVVESTTPAPEPVLISPETPQNVEPTVIPVAPKTKARSEIKQELTNVNGKADSLQIEGLKAAMKQYLTVTNGSEEAQKLIKGISQKTKGLTEITREQCEILLTKIKAEIDKVIPTRDDPTVPF